MKAACFALIAGILAASAACAEPLDYGHVSDRSVCHDTRINIDERIAACQKSIQLGSTTAAAQASTLDGLGTAYAVKGDRVAALDAYAQAIKTDPDAWYAYLNRANVYRVMGRHDLAFADCASALAIRPDGWEGYAVRATVYAADKQVDLEIADLDRAIAIQPDAQIYRIRGEADLVKGDRDRAIVDFTASLKIEPENTVTLTKRAETYLKLKNLELAHADYRTILNVAKYRTVNPMTRAFAERELGQNDAALVDFTAWIVADPKSADAYGFRGWTYQAMGKNDLALADFNEAVARQPPDRPYWLRRRVEVELALNDHALAIVDSDRIATLEPEKSESWNYPCWSRALVGQELDRAAEDCKRAIVLDPTNVAVIDSLGFVQYLQGHAVDAIASYNAALAIDPRLASSLYMRGLLETQGGNAQAGVADIAAAKATDPSVEETYAAYGVRNTK